LLATLLIVTFGEITPQSICGRHGLWVGAHSIPIIWFFLILLLPLSWPISKVLDTVLGVELGKAYNRQELKSLINMHTAQKHGDLTQAETTVLAGALDLSQKRVAEIMTPIGEVFALDIEKRIDLETLDLITKHGYSRIPVFEGDKKKAYRPFAG